MFHVVPPPGAVGDTGVLGIPFYLPESYWTELEAWTKTESEKWLKDVKAKGFKARFEIHHGVQNTAMAIQEIAKNERVDLIAMASVTHGLDAVIVGTVAKEVFRIRKWPVLVFGPEALLNKKSQMVTLL